MELKKIIFFICLIILFLLVSNTYSAWQGPIEVLGGEWGKSDKNFGIETGDME